MKAIVRPVCKRCGYQYDSRRGIRVLAFKCENGRIYTACEKCLMELGTIKAEGASEKEITDFVETFKEEV